MAVVVAVVAVVVVVAQWCQPRRGRHLSQMSLVEGALKRQPNGVGALLIPLALTRSPSAAAMRGQTGLVAVGLCLGRLATVHFVGWLPFTLPWPGCGLRVVADASLINMACMKDGRLLQPDAPDRAIDASFALNGKGKFPASH